MKSPALSSKRKILNDPVYGFITIPHELIFDILQHPAFQRLRRISQLGLTTLVYPGANHSRFQHALGASHLMQQAIEVLRSKGHEVTDDEKLGVIAAILLHDIGHGPYSHTLEKTLVEGVNHEVISSILMEKLNKERNGQLNTAISIFNNSYPKKFLHQLVSSQLDMDRLDYLKRDSFFTGVSEGVIGSDRIIKMLEVVDDQLTVEAKGIYSIEKFIIARRLMYWQVYLHKTVLAGEFLLMKILQRAKELTRKGTEVYGPPSLQLFLKNAFSEADFRDNDEIVNAFIALDDYDILSSIKVWAQHGDFVLSELSKNLVNRRLYKIVLQRDEIDIDFIGQTENNVLKRYGIGKDDLHYFTFNGEISNYAYDQGDDKINILYKDGSVVDIAEAADLLNISALSKPVTKHYLCYPKELAS